MSTWHSHRFTFTKLALLSDVLGLSLRELIRALPLTHLILICVKMIKRLFLVLMLQLNLVSRLVMPYWSWDRFQSLLRPSRVFQLDRWFDHCTRAWVVRTLESSGWSVLLICLVQSDMTWSQIADFQKPGLTLRVLVSRRWSSPLSDLELKWFGSAIIGGHSPTRWSAAALLCVRSRSSRLSTARTA